MLKWIWEFPNERCPPFPAPKGMILTIMVLNRVWFSREPRERINVFVFSIQKKSREREASKIYNSNWILPILDFVTDAKCSTRKVWKWVWILEARSENGCGKWHIFVWNWVRIWGIGRHTPTENSKECPSFPGGRYQPGKRKLSSTWLKSSPRTSGLYQPHLYWLPNGSNSCGSYQ